MTDKKAKVRAEKAAQTIAKSGDLLPSRYRELLDYYLSYTPISEIAEKMDMTNQGVSVMAVRLFENYLYADTPRPREGVGEWRKEAVAKARQTRRVEAKARDEKILSLYKEGLHLNAIAKAVDVGHGTVTRVLAAHGLTPNFFEQTPHLGKTYEHIIDFTEKNVIRRRLNRGMSLKDMASVDNVKRNDIVRTFLRLGVPLPAGEDWYHGKNGEVLPIPANGKIGGQNGRYAR